MKRSRATVILLMLAPLEGTFLGQSALQDTQVGVCGATKTKYPYQFDFSVTPKRLPQILKELKSQILEELKELKSDPQKSVADPQKSVAAPERVQGYLGALRQTLEEFGRDADISFEFIGVKGDKDVQVTTTICEHSLREVVETLTSRAGFLAVKQQNRYTIYTKNADPKDKEPITYNHRLKGITADVAVSQLATVHPSPRPIPSPVKKDESQVKKDESPQHEVVRKFDNLEYSPLVHLNSLLFHGTLDEIKKAVAYLNVFDEASQLISIELMVVEYVHGDKFEWGYNLTEGTRNQFSKIAFDPARAIENSLSFVYNSVERLADSFKFNLSVLSAQNQAKVVTNPSISVRSGETGSIRLDEELHVVVSNASLSFGNVLTLEKITSGVNLRITPHLAGKDLIILDVTGEVAVLIASSRESHSIDRNTVTSKVHVKEGETLILGGLIKERIEDFESGIPGLRSIPVLGYLFKSRTKTTDYVETVIYITPRTNRDLEPIPARKRVSDHMHGEFPKPPGSNRHLPDWHPPGQPPDRRPTNPR